MATAKKNSDQLYKCRIFAQSGSRTVKGEILSIVPGSSIRIKFKKPKSSKYVISPFPWSKIIHYSGEVGGEGTVCVQDERVTTKIVKASIDTDAKTNFLILTTDQNETIYVKPENVDAIADDGVEPPTSEIKKKKDKEKEKEKKK